MEKRAFDFTKHKQRHIVLKILYFGWDYDGLAEQDSSQNSIEYHLFQALRKTCLIESREKCHYNRCGRTDKGVSSYGQVVNLDVRSNLVDEKDPKNVGLFSPEDYSGDHVPQADKQELNYVEILNRVLPNHIKAIAWAPIEEGFSSRFDCLTRAYSYVFPRGDLDIEAMQQAANYLLGEHDFRNLCSLDLKNGVTSHNRAVISVDIRQVSNIGCELSSSNKYGFYEFIIVEHPRIVRDLLDISKCPAKPNYNLASPIPLCLFDCRYDPEKLPLGWFCDTRTLTNLLSQLKKLWLDYKTKSLLVERALSDVELMIENDVGEQCTKKPRLDTSCWKDFGLACDNMSDTKYIPLLKRPRDEPLEFKLDALEKKRKSKDQ